MSGNSVFPTSRRSFLACNSTGFGLAAYSALLQQEAHASEKTDSKHLPTSAALPELHHAPKAKQVIFCYMSGGVSHVDSFDPKPKLKELHGQPMPVKVERTQFNRNGNVMASPFEFRRYGESGLPVSSLFPKVAEFADDLAVVRSMTSPVNEHAQANFFMHSGFPLMGYPSAGAWCSYGLGSENENLPAYVVLQSGDAVPPHGGVALFSNAYLPAVHQGSVMKADRNPAIANIQPLGPVPLQQQRLNLANQLNAEFLAQTGKNAAVEGAIRNYETAFRMQTAVPELCDFTSETKQTMQAYGLESSNRNLAAYGRQCLLARRLVEKGVRFVELSCLTERIGAGGAANPWDQHGDLQRGHSAVAQQVDQPIAALLQDLKQRDLLKDTLVVWAGEFGRTPFSQGSNGRDHNPLGFSVWMAGGGIQGGCVYGATDELGYHAVENRCEIYDLWATVLHQLGINHEKLTYRYSGRDMRLTDVHGRVLHSILS